MKADGLKNVSNKLKQYHHENLTWVRSLEFLKQENSFLKNRLSEVVDVTSDRDVLAQAEHFQNQFIIKDEFLDQLRHDVHEQERILTEKYVRTGNGVDDYVSNRQRKLREQMEYLERDFASLRNEFNRYLTVTL